MVPEVPGRTRLGPNGEGGEGFETDVNGRETRSLHRSRGSGISK